MKNKLTGLILNTAVGKKAAPKVGKMMYTAKTYSPEIFLGVGIAAGVTAGIMLARAHKEAEYDVMENHLEIAHTREVIDETGDYSAAEKASTMTPLYGKLLLAYIRVYGPSILLASTSVYLILASHGVMKARNEALVAAVKVLDEGFKQYRRRVVDEFGADADERLYFGADKQTVVTKEEIDGKTKKVSKDTNVIAEKVSPMVYSRVFERGVSTEFSDNREVNRYFINSNISYLNSKLQLQGWVLLNDVYKALGIEASPEGAVVGWTLDGGDGYIDAGMDLPINQNQGDNRFHLNFNVDGVMYQKISNRFG